MKLRTFILISISSFALFALTVKFSWALDYPMSEEAVAGKEVWQRYNCVSCHTLFGNGGYVGGDLTHITAERTPDYLMTLFNNPPVLPPHQKETHTSLTEKETLAMIAYFEYLNTIPTLGWPPQPKELKGGDVR
ncbi:MULTISPECIES: cytochrome c [Desulfitobacterium]|uniref:Cytochrome c, mono-and diheme variants family n=1 Tax=Desulfitobacterium dehalogenans (strain ATCC 51507 / DSM 9161 / JW/IU-DC1) TaxID=756499 RepID=I4A899_DESDJ|nr:MULTISPECIES: cytochrome c [Desulfitobacterium]AFM00184.1 cytochrome c, mono- and diheme variants family [Desulfitobacterium dehalogenans ATCC 51507]